MKDMLTVLGQYKRTLDLGMAEEGVSIYSDD